MLRDPHLQLLWAARVDYQAGSAVERHQHDQFYQVLLVLTGKGKVVIHETSHMLTSGMICLFHRGIPHQFSFTEPTVTIDFKFQILNKDMEQIVRNNKMIGVCPIEELGELKKWYQLARKITNSPSLFFLSRIDAGFKSTFFSLLSPCANEGSCISPKKVPPLPFASQYHPVIHYVESSFSRKISLDHLAKRFNYHPHYIIKIFQECVGMSPIQYLQAVRINRACSYLEYSKLTISEIAQKVGMTPPAFSRLFQQEVGSAPSLYRKYHVDFIGKDIVLTHHFVNHWRIVKKP
ncbi:AraC family transcriptional regulator [Gracilibacillus phocaeensis]|uniref:AraC family transcriptional regulator n=1 Tax=Gracilibacillus phocaeensis TaxID=2042304 RepID=UPI00103276DF|nr:AraC family transcriptional regulator [Gracilibacillus phocaeensis]